MALNIYSKQLSVGPLPETWGVIYTSIEGITTVVRDVELFNSGSVAALAQITVQGPGGSATLVQVTALEPGQTFQWQGRAVLAPGDELYGNGNGGDVRAWISGYELGP